MSASIKRQLLLPQGIILLAIFTLLIGLTYWRNQTELTSIFESHLRQVAVAIRQQADITQRPVILDGQGAEDDKLITQIWDKNGKLVKATAYGSNIPLQKNAGLNRIYFDDSAWLVYRLDGGRDGITVQAAIHDDILQEITVEGLAKTIPPLVLALILLSAFGWISVNRALRPLDAVKRDVMGKKYDDLSPVAVPGCPAEISPLVDQLNFLLSRLRESIAHEKRFFADAAHQLRTPLAALRLQLDVLKSAGDEAERRSAIRELEAGVERNIQLARQFLALARSEEIATREKTQVDLEKMARRVFSDLAPLAAPKKFRLGVKSAGESPALHVNTGDCYTVFYNLAHNAIHYGRAGGRLEVSLARDARSVTLLFADDGPGIPEQFAERVFDRFFRAGAEQHGEGSGLGLSIVRYLVAGWGGTITLTPGIENRGAGFRIVVPGGDAGKP